jgi:hypothetical protein
MTDATPIRIAGLGMDEHARMMLQMVFKSRAKDTYVIVEEALAEAVIFDMDGFGANELWKSFHAANPGLPVIAMSLRQRPVEGAQALKKPVDISELLRALEQLKQQVIGKRKSVAQLSEPLQKSTHQPVSPKVSAGKPDLHGLSVNIEQRNARRFSGYTEDSVCGYQPDIDLDKAKNAVLDKLYYDPARHLQGILAQAAELGHNRQGAIEIAGLSGILIVLPHKNQVLYDLGEESLRPLCMLPLNAPKVAITPLSDEAVSQRVQIATSSLHYSYLDRFLWQVGIWTAHGRLPKDTPLDAPIVLTRWPNFTRLPVTPRALQIAALWIEQAYSLVDTAKILAIPQRYVFTFYSAAHGQRLAFPDRRHGRQDAPASIHPLTQQPSAKRNLFQRILSHLHK